MYKIEKEKVIIEGKEVDTYGISNGNSVINDVSSNLEFVQTLTDMLNKYEVSDVHFSEIVEDSIIDEEYFLSIIRGEKFKTDDK